MLHSSHTVVSYMFVKKAGFGKTDRGSVLCRNPVKTKGRSNWPCAATWLDESLPSSGGLRVSMCKYQPSRTRLHSRLSISLAVITVHTECKCHRKVFTPKGKRFNNMNPVLDLPSVSVLPSSAVKSDRIRTRTGKVRLLQPSYPSMKNILCSITIHLIAHSFAKLECKTF